MAAILINVSVQNISHTYHNILRSKPLIRKIKNNYCQKVTCVNCIQYGGHGRWWTLRQRQCRPYSLLFLAMAAEQIENSISDDGYQKYYNSITNICVVCLFSCLQNSFDHLLVGMSKNLV